MTLLKIMKGILFMSTKYDRSFEADVYPMKCPFCDYKFNYQEDVQIDPYKKGYRSVLYCDKCNYKKVLSYTLEEDIDAE